MAIKHAGDRMIPVDTKLTLEQVELTKKAIKRRYKLLSKKELDIDSTLWTMEELEHLECLLKNNS